MNKPTNMILISLFIMGILLLSSCSSGSNKETNYQRPGNMPTGSHDNWQQHNGSRNMPQNFSQEDMQQLREERQKAESDACLDKSEGDSCELEFGNNSVEGSCTSMNDELVCFSGQRMPPEQR